MKSLYETDFYAWTQQIELLKEQEWHSLDVQDLIEKLANLGRSERQEFWETGLSYETFPLECPYLLEAEH